MPPSQAAAIPNRGRNLHSAPGAKVDSLASSFKPSLNAPERARQQIRLQLGTRWKSGDRLPPVRKLAEVLGAGQSTTHQAVKMLVAEGLLIAQRGIGTLVCPGVQPLVDEVGRHDGTVELRRRNITIMHTGSDQLFVQAAATLRNELNRQGFTASTVDYNIIHQQKLIQTHRSADALVMINPAMELLQTHPTQHLLVISTAVNPIIVNTGGYDVVGVDSRHGGHLAGAHLKAISTGPACFVGSVDHVTGEIDATSAVRLAGFEFGWGQPLPVGHVLLSESYTIEAAAAVVPAIMRLNPRPLAIFCASDELAVGVAIGSLGQGLKAGRDFMLVGFDGQERAQTMRGGPMTTITLPWPEMVDTAVDLLIRRFRQPDRLIHRVHIGCRLQQGATTTQPAPDIT